MRNKSREAFRNEWKYLISTSEKEMLTLRLKPFLQPDPHAGDEATLGTLTRRLLEQCIRGKGSRGTDAKKIQDPDL